MFPVVTSSLFLSLRNKDVKRQFSNVWEKGQLSAAFEMFSNVAVKPAAPSENFLNSNFHRIWVSDWLLVMQKALNRLSEFPPFSNPPPLPFPCLCPK